MGEEIPKNQGNKMSNFTKKQIINQINTVARITGLITGIIGSRYGIYYGIIYFFTLGISGFLVGEMVGIMIMRIIWCAIDMEKMKTLFEEE
jgi:hypothetical protein